MVHLIMASEPCEKASFAPFIFLIAALVNDIKPRALQLSVGCKCCIVDTRPERALDPIMILLPMNEG
jgi:hypothetical protein